MKQPEDFKPPFSDEDVEIIDRILEEAQIDPDDHFTIPDKADPRQPGRFTNPDVPVGRIKENYNGQRGDGTWTDLDFDWQPGCEEVFAISLSEVWTPPPAGLANKFKLWAKFATARAVLICRQNRRCRRVHPLGCESAWDVRFPNGRHYARARFAFECLEI